MSTTEQLTPILIHAEIWMQISKGIYPEHKIMTDQVPFKTILMLTKHQIEFLQIDSKNLPSENAYQLRCFTQREFMVKNFLEPIHPRCQFDEEVYLDLIFKEVFILDKNEYKVLNKFFCTKEDEHAKKVLQEELNNYSNNYSKKI